VLWLAIPDYQKVIQFYPVNPANYILCTALISFRYNDIVLLTSGCYSDGKRVADILKNKMIVCFFCFLGI